jgi:hypothetical protein
MTVRDAHIPGLIGGLLQQDRIEIFRPDLCDLAVSLADQGSAAPSTSHVVERGGTSSGVGGNPIKSNRP